MLVIRIWNYFRGYVIIKIEGLTLERFINLSIAKGIYLWDIIRYDYTTLEAKVGLKGFKSLREVVKRVGCRVYIIEKKGFPFLIHKLKYRKMLVFGFAVAVGIIIFLTSFIWEIEVIGNENADSKLIVDYLTKMDIKPGILKSEIDISELKRSILRDIENISFVNMEIIGTKLLVEVKVRDVMPSAIRKDVPCNVVAKKKAVIVKVIARNGKSVVEKGDIVKKGQVLISGIIEDEKLENPLLVHSDGTVLGKTLYVKELQEPIIKKIEEETGNCYSVREIKIGNYSLLLNNKEIPYKNYIEDKKNRKLIKILGYELPFEIIVHKYKEVELIKVKQNVEALKKMQSVRGVQMIMNELPKGAKVISKDVKYSIEDNILITRVSIEVIEEIGEKQKIQ
ncbi:similar to stage IV sporulation protein [Caloranaerobacter azorensis DSM 13643]|uniref:Similar to stage IV sporulation protein n=1 Tax=Caloranaerobacter azorensis DSM 13643 TaxID=1121264 RepID=A0A1M5S886_9FIRM|nr:sporulation protein YqfD [Caloranaerobacter azorensis]SHH34655.1 similar to stage IV sporulation protein [Caloranaerobacter azorensis DSM 13643]